MKIMQGQFLITLLTALTSLFAFGQAENDQEAYKIEFIVFAYPDFEVTQETFNERIITFNEDELVRLEDENKSISINQSTLMGLLEEQTNQLIDNTGSDFNSDITNEILIDSESVQLFKLNYLSNALDSLQGFERRAVRRDDISIIQQGSWIQVPNSEIKLSRVIDNNDSIIFLNFYKDKYLHLDVTAALGFETIEHALIENNIYAETIYGSSVTFKEADNADTQVIKFKQQIPKSIKTKYWIKEDRRVFNKEIHFFDHPTFGLLISIDKVVQ